MDGSSADNVTLLLADWRNGDAHALERMLPIVYRELQRLAAAYLRRERVGHTLQPTALVHEAYVRLVDQQTPVFRNRSHFFGVAAHVMRQVLVDSARKKRSAKRGGGHDTSLDAIVVAAPERPRDIVALDDALSALAAVDARKARVIEMRYFGGLGNAEIAEALDVSVPTVVRDARFAEAWLRQHLEGGG
ncbi:MAG: sigma-70 family RNA polymerase sigma factor [Vicinamibacterales bacterium]